MLVSSLCRPNVLWSLHFFDLIYFFLGVLCLVSWVLTVACAFVLVRVTSVHLCFHQFVLCRLKFGVPGGAVTRFGVDSRCLGLWQLLGYENQ